MDILKIFFRLEKFERLMRTLYEKHSKLFADDREASGLFYRLSLDEKSHEELVRYQNRLVKKSPEHFAEAEADMVAIEEAVSKVKTALNRSTEPSLEEAVMFAIDLEGSAIEGYHRSLMKQSNQEAARLVDSLGTETNDHLQTLLNFAVMRGWLPAQDNEPPN
jgi:rubrerythrin